MPAGGVQQLVLGNLFDALDGGRGANDNRAGADEDALAVSQRRANCCGCRGRLDNTIAGSPLVELSVSALKAEAERLEGGHAGVHVEEEEYRSLLITGYLNSSNFLSRVELGMLEDVGFSVDYTKAAADASVCVANSARFLRA